MKNISLIIFILFAQQYLMAQVDKGRFMVGGTLSYQKGSINQIEFYDDPGKQEFSFSPKLGFSFSKNWIVGIIVSTDREQDAYLGPYDVPYERKNKAHGGGIFLRKFQPFSDKFGIFADLNINYRVDKSDFTIAATHVENWKQEQYSLYIAPGVYYKPIKILFVECTFGRVGYIHTTITPPDGPKTKQDGFIPSNLSVGIFFIL